MEWKPNENVENGEIAISAMEDAGEEWSIINQISYKPAAGDSIGYIPGPKMKNLRIALSEVKQFKVKVLSTSFT